MSRSGTNDDESRPSEFGERLRAKSLSYWREQLPSRFTRTDGPLEDENFSSLFAVEFAAFIEAPPENIHVVWRSETPPEVRDNEWHGFVLVDFIFDELSFQLRVPIAIAVFAEHLLVSVDQTKSKQRRRRQFLESLNNPSDTQGGAKHTFRAIERSLAAQLDKLAEPKHYLAPWVEKRTEWRKPSQSPVYIEAFTWNIDSLVPEWNNPHYEPERKDIHCDQTRLVVWSDGDVTFEGKSNCAPFSGPMLEHADRIRGTTTEADVPVKLDIRGCVPLPSHQSHNLLGNQEKWRIHLNSAQIGDLRDDEQVRAASYFFLNYPTKFSVQFSALGCEFAIGPTSTDSYRGSDILKRSRKHPLGLLNGCLTIRPSETQDLTGAQARQYAEMTIHLLIIASGTVARIVTERQVGANESFQGLRARPQRAALNTVGSKMFCNSHREAWSNFFTEALPLVLGKDDVMDRIDITANQWGSINSLPFLDNRIGQTAIATEGLIRYIAVTRLEDQFVPMDGGLMTGIRRRDESGEASFGDIAKHVLHELGLDFDDQLAQLWKKFRNGFAHHGSLHEHDEDLFQDVYVPLRRHYQELILAWIGWDGDYRQYGEGFSRG